MAVTRGAPLLARIAEPEELAAAMPLLREIRHRLDRARDNAA
jgi:hypothetical protein